MYTGKS